MHTGSFAQVAASDDEIFTVFDEQMRPVGAEKRLRVHTEGLLHQSVHLLLFFQKNHKNDGSDESNASETLLLLQQRAAKKRIAPLLWDLSCAEHLTPEESAVLPWQSGYEQAALRGAREELNIDLKREQIKLARPVQLFRRVFNYEANTPDGVVKRTYHENEFIACFSAYLTQEQVDALRIDPEEVAQISWKDPKIVVEEIKRDPETFAPWFIEERESILKSIK